MLSSTTFLQQSEPQQSNRAHVAVVDSEVSPQASSDQDRGHYIPMGIVGFIPEVELQVRWRTTTWRKRPRVFGTQSRFDEACAVASQVAGRTIVPGGPKQHVQGRSLSSYAQKPGPKELSMVSETTWCTFSTTRTTSTRLTPLFAVYIEFTDLSRCLHE